MIQYSFLIAFVIRPRLDTSQSLVATFKNAPAADLAAGHVIWRKLEPNGDEPSH